MAEALDTLQENGNPAGSLFLGTGPPEVQIFLEWSHMFKLVSYKSVQSLSVRLSTDKNCSGPAFLLAATLIKYVQIAIVWIAFVSQKFYFKSQATGEIFSRGFEAGNLWF